MRAASAHSIEEIASSFQSLENAAELVNDFETPSARI